MKRFSALLSIILLINFAQAGEYLEPESNVDLAGYDDTVKLVFQDAFREEVRARAIVEPSFQTEFVVGIVERAGKFGLFSLEANDQVWQYATLQMLKNGQERAANRDGTDRTADEIKKLEARLPADPRGVRVKRCDLPIDQLLGEKLVGVWKTALLRVKPQPPTMGLDGEIYHFSMTVDGKNLSAQTWSPPENSQAGLMVGIAYAMRDACEKKDRGKIQVMDRLATSLEKQLQ